MYIKAHISWSMFSSEARDIGISAWDIPERSVWKSESELKTFYSNDTMSRDENSSNSELDYLTPLLSNSSMIWIIFNTSEKIAKNWFILYRILSLNIELFNKEFQSIILELMHNNLLLLLVAL